MENMAAMLALVRATCTAVIARPLYYVTLLVFGAGIYFSKYVTLFEFARELHMVREMGVATMTLWGLILVTVTSGQLVTNELEDKTALLLLAKPLKRSHFLWGKFLGVVWAQGLGVVFLCCIFFLTLWNIQGTTLVDHYISSKEQSLWEYLWSQFISANLGFVAEAGLLCLFQLAVLSAICLSLAAFFPMIVTVSATALLYILGNVSSHFVANLKHRASGVADLAQAAAYVLPNLSYFNLQIHFSEGELVSLNYLLLLTGYTIIYVGLVIWLASLVFETREVR
jgi:ABC-type transport system involved in multi-copper enzyme maturation permease subunit